MNPHDFQTSVLAWLVVIVALASPVAHAYFAIKKAWQDEQEKAELRKQLALQGQQINQNTARLNGQSGKIDTLMLSAAPPNQPPSFAVAVSGGETTTSSDNEQKDNPNE